MKTKYQIMFTLLLLIFINSVTLTTYGQEKLSSLKDKRISIHRENESLGTIFRDLIENYDIPIGFELSVFDFKNRDYLFEVNTSVDCTKCISDCKNGVGPFILVNCENNCKQRVFTAKVLKFTINVDNEPLEDVLNQIVSKMKYYKWEITDGVVNILPVSGRDSRFEDILNVKINSFVNKDVYGLKSKKVSDLRNSIISTPEIKTFLKSNNLFFSSTTDISPNLGKEVENDLIFSDITLKELLNKITKIKRGGWQLKQNDLIQDNRYFFIDIDI